MQASLRNAISNISQGFYDIYVEANARFRARSGIKTIIVRRQVMKCCDWCAQLSGIYDYSNAPADIFRRHDNCRCIVTVKTEKGAYQDAWSKKEYLTQRAARLARAEEITKGNAVDELNRLKRVAKDRNEKYADTTEYWRKRKHEPGIVRDAKLAKIDGKRYYVQGKNVVLSYTQDEYTTGELLSDFFGGLVEMVPRVNWPQNVKTPDYVVNGIRFDRKAPTGASKNTIKNNIGAAEGQANNVVLDLTKCGLDVNSALKYCKDAYSYNHLGFLDMLVVVRDGEIVKVFEKV